MSYTCFLGWSVLLARFEDPQSDRRCAAGSRKLWEVGNVHSKTKHQVFSLEFVQVLVHVTQMAPIALFPYAKPFGRDSMFNRLFFTPAGPLVYGQAGVRQAFTAAAGDWTVHGASHMFREYSIFTYSLFSQERYDNTLRKHVFYFTFTLAMIQRKNKHVGFAFFKVCLKSSTIDVFEGVFVPNKQDTGSCRLWS